MYQGAAKMTGSTTDTTPNATDAMASPIKVIEAHTPKAISEEYRRPRFGTR
jgi:hypothetical protein